MIRFMNFFIITVFVTILFLIGLAITIPNYIVESKESYLYGIIMFSSAIILFGIGIVMTIMFKIEITENGVTFKCGKIETKKMDWASVTIEVNNYRGGRTLYLTDNNDTYSIFISKKIRKKIEELAPKYVVNKVESSYNAK